MVVRILGRALVLVSASGLLAAYGCVSAPDAPEEGSAGMGAASGVGGTQSSETGGTGGRGGAATAGGSAGRGGTSSSGGSSTTTGGSGGTAPVDVAGAAGEGGVESTGEGGAPSAGRGGTGAVSAGDPYPEATPPVCTDTWIDFDCDGVLPLECAAPDEVISFDPARNEHCPVCATPPAGSRSCERAQREYREFLSSIIGPSCANWCDEDADCAAWELTTSCGTVALSLTGGIDEEPMGFAEEFAATRCSELCGSVPTRMTLRRAGSPNLEFDPSTGLLDDLGPRCVSNQCVLAPL